MRNRGTSTCRMALSMPRSSLRSVRFCRKRLPTTGKTGSGASSLMMLARSSEMRTEMPEARAVWTTPGLTPTSGSGAAMAGFGSAI